MIIDILEVGMYFANCYIVGCAKTRKGIIIDPGDSGDFIISKVNENNLHIEKIVITHGHLDHIGALEYLKEKLKVKVCIHEDDDVMLTSPEKNLSVFSSELLKGRPADILLKEGDEIVFGEVILEVLHTPGHSPGGISLYGDGAVFTGDTIFLGSVGRTDFPNGDFDVLMESIKKKIFTLPDETVIYSGHGPDTTVGQEKNYNPFVK